MCGKELLFGPNAVTFSIGFFAIFLLYWFSSRNLDYWKMKSIPYVKTYPFLGSKLKLFTRPIHVMELERYNELGPLYGCFEGNMAVLSVANPALLRRILVTDFQYFPNRREFKIYDKTVGNMLFFVEGEDWKRIRSIISPAFSTVKIKRMLSIFEDCSKTLVQNFKEAVNAEKPIEAKSLYGAFTMDVIASSAFSTKLNSHDDPENQFVQMARTIFARKLDWRMIVLLVFPMALKFLHISIFPPKAIEFFKAVTYQIIEERKRTGQVRNDFLQLLMDTANELKEEHNLDSATDNDDGNIAENYGEDDISQKILKTITSKGLSMEELVAQCVLFFSAAYETTTSTLAFASYLLSLNPEIQDKLRKEVDEALTKHNGEITYEAIKSMKYLDNIISETLRIFPPIIRMERSAEADYELGDTGLTIPKGMLITIPVYAIHRDPKYFPNPEKFDPDRFTAKERAKRDQYVYLPFGIGPRNCIGMKFALIEIKICLAHVISAFIIKRCPKTKVPLDFHLGTMFLQPKEIFLEMEPRIDGPLLQ